MDGEGCWPNDKACWDKEPAAYRAPRLLHHPGTPTVPPDATPRHHAHRSLTLLHPASTSAPLTLLHHTASTSAPLDAPPITHQCAHKDCIDASKPISVGIVTGQRVAVKAPNDDVRGGGETSAGAGAGGQTAVCEPGERSRAAAYRASRPSPLILPPLHPPRTTACVALTLLARTIL